MAAVKAAGLVDTLNGPGPFTVFAPTNQAFARLPASTADNLFKPENRVMLKNILMYHVVAGKFRAKDLIEKINQGGGTAELSTLQGGKLWAISPDGKHIELKNQKGDTATLTIPDMFQPNGVIHVIDTVLTP